MEVSSILLTANGTFNIVLFGDFHSLPSKIFEEGRMKCLPLNAYLKSSYRVRLSSAKEEETKNIWISGYCKCTG